MKGIACGGQRWRLKVSRGAGEEVGWPLRTRECQEAGIVGSGVEEAVAVSQNLGGVTHERENASIDRRGELRRNLHMCSGLGAGGTQWQAPVISVSSWMAVLRWKRREAGSEALSSFLVSAEIGVGYGKN